MSLSIVKILPRNPNGRSGCACSPHGKRSDCTPPYACFTATEAMDPRNPVFVVGFKCLQTAMTKASRAPQGAAELRRQNPPDPEAEPAEPAEPKVVDLMAALKASLDAAIAAS